jgi:hypothetical protein
MPPSAFSNLATRSPSSQAGLPRTPSAGRSRRSPAVFPLAFCQPAAAHTAAAPYRACRRRCYAPTHANGDRPSASPRPHPEPRKMPPQSPTATANSRCSAPPRSRWVPSY